MISRILMFFLFTFILSTINFGQTVDFVENWITPNDIPLKLTYKSYNSVDVENALNKLKLIRKENKNVDWKGKFVYSLGTVTSQQIYLSQKHGFVEFSYYTCQPTLNYLNYGIISETSDTIRFIPESNPNSPINRYSAKELVKVKWHGNNFLVYENELIDFSKMTAGLYVISEDMAQPNFGYYSREQFPEFDETKDEMPIYPDRFKKYLRSPVKAKINNIISRKLNVEKNQWDEIERTLTYKISINAGKSSDVRVGVKFYFNEGTDFIEIIKVKENNSIGKIVRTADSDGDDICSDLENERIKCIDISDGKQVRTKSQYNLNH